MKPPPFEYFAPQSLEEALDLKSQYSADEARLLAGGQSLVPAMNFRVVQPSVIIDLNRVAELSYIREADGVLRIGAMTRTRQLEFDPLIAERSPLLLEAVPHVAHPQIRNRGTLGGSLANADPAAELPVIMLALAARLKARSSSGERWIEAQHFFSGMFSTDLGPDEILVEIELPSGPALTGWSFLEVAPRGGDYALMGVAALLTLGEDEVCKRARLVYLNAGDGPVQAPEAAHSLEGVVLNETLIESAAALASGKEIHPFGNIHASAEYQRHLANVLTKRALAIALNRAHPENLQ
jgi:carbon-monoxide dehydrogenase medium subunit